MVGDIRCLRCVVAWGGWRVGAARFVKQRCLRRSLNWGRCGHGQSKAGRALRGQAELVMARLMIAVPRARVVMTTTLIRRTCSQTTGERDRDRAATEGKRCSTNSSKRMGARLRKVVKRSFNRSRPSVRARLGQSSVFFSVCCAFVLFGGPVVCQVARANRAGAERDWARAGL